MGNKRTSSDKLWKVVGIAAILSTTLLVAGFGYAVKDLVWPTPEQTQTAIKSPQAELPAKKPLSESNEIRITAVGDSLTKGFGDDEGQGYVKQVVAMLKDKWGIPVRLNNNLAVNGLRADELAESLLTNKGYQYTIQQANLILFTIGGNDLFQSVTGEKASEATGQFDLEKLKAGMPAGIKRFEAVIEQIHALNPNAHVVYVGLFNPFYEVADLRVGSTYIQQWNQQVYDILHRYDNMTIVPTYDLFENASSLYLSSDHFHPNHLGYEQIATRIVQSLR
ncbi:GDSL-type esterase/lipase family protein [Paenibacillus aurantiacus]|uniref:GDSL-type esterase/lipase family protein n=1 Tax=Paenibacillus aurantiacus TaxID=1936118 RepID=A0ABV5L005_9BACL